MLSKKFIVIASILLLVFIGFGMWLGFYLSSSQSNPAASSDYSAVYLSTGDIYFGKLSWFPRPRLDNVWFMRNTLGQNNQPQLGIAPLAGAFWGPVDHVYLNPQNIILWTSLRQDSQLVKAFANPASLSQQTQPPQNPPQATSTKK